MMPCCHCGLPKDTCSFLFDALFLCMVYPELAVQLWLLGLSFVGTPCADLGDPALLFVCF